MTGSPALVQDIGVVGIDLAFSFDAFARRGAVKPDLPGFVTKGQEDRSLRQQKETKKRGDRRRHALVGNGVYSLQSDVK